MNVLHYWMLEPPRGGIEDQGKPPAFEQHIAGPAGEALDLALFCDESGDPHFIRIRDRGASIDTWQSHWPLIWTARQHLVSVLSLTRMNGGRLLSAHFYCEEGVDGHGAHIKVDWPTMFNFDPDLARGMYEHTFAWRQSLRMLVDSANDDIPLQYRFLSLYRFLEMRFRGDNDKWDYGALNRAPKPCAGEYASLRLDRTFFAELKHLRDRCAHIKSGSGPRRRLGVTGLNHEAEIEVERVLPIVQKICLVIFNEAHAGKVVLSDIRPWYKRIQAP